MERTFSGRFSEYFGWMNLIVEIMVLALIATATAFAVMAGIERGKKR
jgi:hypothetical protein